MSELRFLPTWKNRPVQQAFVMIEELPESMKVQRAVFIQTKLIVQTERHGYPSEALQPHREKLTRLKGML